jgi:hypothetical protein
VRRRTSSERASIDSPSRSEDRPGQAPRHPRHRSLPPWERRQHSLVQLHFSVDRHGQLPSANVVKSSGWIACETAVVQRNRVASGRHKGNDCWVRTA